MNKGRSKWINLGIGVAAAVLSLVGAHFYELSSSGGSPDAAQRYQGYQSYMDATYSPFRVVALALFGTIVIYVVVSPIANAIMKMRGKSSSQ